MIPPFMLGSLILMPKSISFIALVLLLIASIAELRKHHIGRVALAANVFLLWQIFYSTFQQLPGVFQWYLDLGSVVAVVGLFTYLTRSSLPSKFYNITMVLYGSLSVVAVVAAFFLGLI